MTNSTLIKVTKDGRQITLQGVFLCIAGQSYAACQDERQVVALTSAEQAKVPGYSYRVGALVFSSAEAQILINAIRANKSTIVLEQSKPANIDRHRIADLHRKADRLEDYPGESIPMHMEADRLYAIWCDKYPEEAKEERRQELIAKADHQRELASGALTYDADGSIGPEMQRERYNQFTAKALEFEAQAKAL
jgi:hypothetical protein